jgi:hypothetical protein
MQICVNTVPFLTGGTGSKQWIYCRGNVYQNYFLYVTLKWKLDFKMHTILKIRIFETIIIQIKRKKTLPK